jgi:hypothetical protein
MKNKIIFLSLLSLKSYCSVEEYRAYLDNLKLHATNAKTSIKILKHSPQLTEKDMVVIQKAIWCYLECLTDFYEYLKKDRPKTGAKS